MPHFLRLALAFISIFIVCVERHQCPSLRFCWFTKDGNFEHGEVEKWPTVQLIFQNPHNPLLCLHQISHWQFPVSDFFVDCLYLQWKNLFHFAGYQHALHSHQMQFRRREAFGLCLEIPVHERNTIEISFWAEFVWGGDLDHPVEHASAEETIDAVPA
jgi:hypothetical protein